MLYERGERPQGGGFEGDGPPVLPEPINWWKLDNEERRVTLDDLRVFVLNLTEYYVLSEQLIPRCWYQHSALIQELLALFQYRNQQQFGPGASVQGPIDFHTQFVQHAIPRLRGWVTDMGCNASEHYPDDDRYASWMAPESKTHAEWKTDFHEYLDANYGVGGAHDTADSDRTE